MFNMKKMFVGSSNVSNSTIVIKEEKNILIFVLISNTLWYILVKRKTHENKMNVCVT